jgi:hypothetical protein
MFIKLLQYIIYENEKEASTNIISKIKMNSNNGLLRSVSITIIYIMENIVRNNRIPIKDEITIECMKVSRGGVGSTAEAADANDATGEG